jgi:hypothetical protein
MKKLILALFAAVVAIPASSTAWDAVTVPSTRRVMPAATLAFTTYDKAVMEGARNEWEAFQIIVRSAKPVSGINVVLSDLTDDSGNTIPASAAKLYREWFFNVVNPSGAGVQVTNHERQPGLYAEPLIPFVDPYSNEVRQVGAPFDLTAEDPGLAVVYIDIHIPADAVPSIYRGTATVTATDQVALTIPVELTAWELDMPSEKTVGTSFRMSEDNVRLYHGGTDPEQTSEKYAEIVRNYYIAGHENRIDPTGFTGPVTFNFGEDGHLLDVDWTSYDAFMTPYVDGSYFPDGIGVTRFDVGLFRPGRSRTMTDEQYKEASAALATHLDEKGWWHKAWVYSTDEPWMNGGEEEWNEVIRDATLLREGSSLWDGHVLVTGPKYEPAGDVIGIWCPVQPMFEKWFWTDNDYAGRGDYDAHIAGGGELWFYNCNGNFPPYPGYDIDTAIGYEPRILKWASYFEGATGYLYWRQLYWGHFDPWVEWQNVEGFGNIFARNGDGLLMYPGDHDGTYPDPKTPAWLSIDGPIVGFRLKQIRDGFEDWEMFVLAEKAGIGDWVHNEISKIYDRFGALYVEDCTVENYYCPDREPWTLDENQLLEVRRRIAAKLMFTMYPDKYPDPDAPIVSEDEGAPVEQAEITDDVMGDTSGDTTATDTKVTDTNTAMDADTGADVNGDTQPDISSNGCSTASTPTSVFAAVILFVLAFTAFRLRRLSSKIDS